MGEDEEKEKAEKILFVTKARAGTLALSDAEAGTSQHHVEVHSVNSDGGVVLQAQVDVLIYKKQK